MVPLLIAADAAGGWNLIFASVWFSSAHAAQYLWVTAYYERSSGRSASVGNFLWKSLLAGTALSILPAFVLAPDLLGDLPIDVGLAAVIFAALNIHHFILDGAIWKLRDGRVARILLRAPDQAALPATAEARTSRPWIRRLVWGIAGACLVAQLMNYYATASSQRRRDSRGILSAARSPVDRSGNRRHPARDRPAVGGGGRSQRRNRALPPFDRALPPADAWVALGSQYRAEGKAELALAAFDAAIEWIRVGSTTTSEPSPCSQRFQSNGAPIRLDAIRSLERALEIRPGHAKTSQLLARPERRHGAPRRPEPSQPR